MNNYRSCGCNNTANQGAFCGCGNNQAQGSPCGCNRPAKPEPPCGCNKPVRPESPCGCGNNQAQGSSCGCSCGSLPMQTTESTCAITDCFCHNEIGCIEERPLGMAYVPIQQWQHVSCSSDGLLNGTIFKELVKPFYCTQCSKGRRCNR